MSKRSTSWQIGSSRNCPTALMQIARHAPPRPGIPLGLGLAALAPFERWVQKVVDFYEDPLVIRKILDPPRPPPTDIPPPRPPPRDPFGRS